MGINPINKITIIIRMLFAFTLFQQSLEYLVTNFLPMHEIDKMWKIENSKIQSEKSHPADRLSSP
jgi:hypothetical protein